jgi:hypothetical protein
MNFRADPETTLSGLDARGAVPLPFAVSKEDLFSNFDYYFADPIASGCETLANAERLCERLFAAIPGPVAAGVESRGAVLVYFRRLRPHSQQRCPTRANWSLDRV